MGEKILPLKRLLKQIDKGEGSMDGLTQSLHFFSCRDGGFDEERFLKEKSIDFERRDRARTFLVSTPEQRIAGFFSLAMSTLNIEGISPSQRKRITAGKKNFDHCTSFLIGQLAKDKNSEKGFGDYLLDSALAYLRQAQSFVGGRVVYLECKDVPALRSFYEARGFKFLQRSPRRNLLQYYQIL